MWTSTMDLDWKKVLLTQFLGRFYRSIYFSSYSPLQVQNLPRQSLPERSWVRVRNRLAGISASDLHQLYHQDDPRVATTAGPDRKRYYPGHEVVGEVIEIGDDVRHLNVGDRVALQYGPNCYTADIQPPCHACSTGNYYLCEQGALLAQHPLGGGWSEEMLLHEQQLYRVPETLTDEQAVMLEPTALATHAVLQRPPQSGDRVLIIGAGTVGLLTQQVVNALAPHAEVSILARYPFQVEQATRQGADHIIYPRDAYTGVQRATNARLYHGLLGNQTLLGGYDVIYDTVGKRNTLHHALRWTRAGGAIVLVGLRPRMMHIDLTPVWAQEIKLLGSTAHGVERWPLRSEEQRSTYEVVTELIEHGRLSPEQLITHHFALTSYQHALLTATRKTESRAVKVIFDYSLLPASVVPNVRASAPKTRRPTTVNFGLPTSSQGADLPVARTSSTSIPTPQHRSVPLRTPTANQYTSASGTRYTRPVVDDDEDEVTETALPSLRHRATRSNRSASTASGMTPPPAQPALEFAALPRPQELTRETYPTSKPPTGSAKAKPTTNLPMDEELDAPTRRVSRDEIKKYLMDARVPSTELPSMITHETPTLAPDTPDDVDEYQVADDELATDEDKQVASTGAEEPLEPVAPTATEEVHDEPSTEPAQDSAHDFAPETSVNEETNAEEDYAGYEDEQQHYDDDAAEEAPIEELSYEQYDEDTRYEDYNGRADEDYRDGSYDPGSAEDFNADAEEMAYHSGEDDDTEATDSQKENAMKAHAQSLQRAEVPAIARTKNVARSRNRKKKGSR